MVARYAALAMAGIGRRYPYHQQHLLHADADARPPHLLTPLFGNCFDWHSSVHNHWLLVRLLRRYPDASFAAGIRATLSARFTAAHVAGEVAYLQAPGRESFERPYGLAWLLLLYAELSAGAQMQTWARHCAPLATLAAQRLRDWLPKLAYPVRSGTHNQTAFAFALALDAAETLGDNSLATAVRERARQFHGTDRDAPLHWEPSGEDFLSPCLMEADLMRRVLPEADFPDWLTAFLPGIPVKAGAEWLQPAVVHDRRDGRLVHLDGLNLSRAWNLQAIAAALPATDPRRAALLHAAGIHRQAGLAAVDSGHYTGTHWLASFAVYLVTDKALEASCG